MKIRGYYCAVARDTVFEFENRAPQGGNDFLWINIDFYAKDNRAGSGEKYAIVDNPDLYADFELSKIDNILCLREFMTNDGLVRLYPQQKIQFTGKQLIDMFNEVLIDKYDGSPLIKSNSLASYTSDDNSYFFAITVFHEYPYVGHEDNWNYGFGVSSWSHWNLYRFNETAVAQKRANAAACGFSDVSSTDYYCDAVKWAKENNVTTGISELNFNPTGTCTRGQVVTFLWRAMGCPEPATTKNAFTDVKASDYYYKAVLWAVEQGITAGTSATTFDPNGTCSNAHILTFLWRTMGKPDAQSGSKWYSEAENWAKANGLMTDTSAASNITGNCPRSDAVTFLYRELAK